MPIRSKLNVLTHYNFLGIQWFGKSTIANRASYAPTRPLWLALLLTGCFLLLACEPQEKTQQNKKLSLEQVNHSVDGDCFKPVNSPGPGNSPTPMSSPEEDNSLEPDSSNILATVNKSPITAAQRDQAIKKVLSGTPQMLTNQKINKKILESLVINRAMAFLLDKEMTEQEKKLLDDEMKASRDAILAKRYIAKYISPEPVNDQQIQTYYEQHPQAFGGELIKIFEVIQMNLDMLANSQRRAQQLDVLKLLETEKNWSQAVTRFEQQGFKLHYHKTESNSRLLHEPLAQLVQNSGAGKTPATYINGKKAWIVKVLKTRTIADKPLEQVKHLIRKRLIPIQVKKAITKISEEAKNKVTIRYNTL